MGINKKLRGLVATAALVLASAIPSQGFALTNALYITMDGSGSISSGDFSLQLNGYINALNDVFSGGGLYGNTAIGVSVFSSGVNQVFAMQEITSSTELAALTAAIGSITQPNSVTNIGDAIHDAALAIDGSFSTASNKVIDVSTDGYWNTGADPDTTAATALSSYGITTNCLGVGGGADCSFYTGFAVAANNFTEFENALKQKLQRELGVPAPGIAMLMGIGLVGIGVARRRQAA